MEEEGERREKEKRGSGEGEGRHRGVESEGVGVEKGECRRRKRRVSRGVVEGKGVEEKVDGWGREKRRGSGEGKREKGK